MSTIFDKIITREVPAEIIYEDDVVIAFLDIKPIHLGHTLVVPKVPFADIFSGDDDTLAHMMRVGAMLGRRLKDKLGVDGVNLSMNNGVAAGQEIFHAHLHVIPRYTDDGAYAPAKHEVATPTALADTAQKLRQ
jgi:histidine triad (HIT) family protein